MFAIRDERDYVVQARWGWGQRVAAGGWLHITSGSSFHPSHQGVDVARLISVSLLIHFHQCSVAHLCRRTL